MGKLAKSGASSNNEFDRSKIEELRTRLELIEIEIENEWSSKDLAGIDKNKLKNEITFRKENGIFIASKKKIMEEKILACSLKSPRSGKITYLKVKYEGEFLDRGSIVAKIAENDNRRWVLKAFIDDNNIHFIRVGTKAKIELKSVDSYIRDELDGMVIFISPDSMKNLPGSTTETPQYEVHATFDSEDSRIKPGSSANLRLLPGRRSLFDIIYEGGGI
jgi:multidrug resistance efflux pump